MDFDTIADIVDGHPHMDRRAGRRLYDHVVENQHRNVLELGTYHGVSTCYLAAAVDEVGDGHVMTMDREIALRLDPNVLQLLEMTGLADRVTPVFAKVSFTWELKRLLERSDPPTFDFAFLDAGHMWDVTGFAFFLVDRLLRPGGWMLFDDLNWSVAASQSVSEKDWARQLPQEEREAKQVEAVFRILVEEDPRYETKQEGNWGWAHKSVPGPATNTASTIERLRSIWRR